MNAVIIGAGRMGRRHIQVARQAGLEVVGISDVSADALSAAMKEHAVPAGACFADSLAMLRQVRPNVVIVATTAPTHAELTCAAVDAGATFVLCEKPMAVSLEECDRMMEACVRTGARLAINHQMRFMEQYTAVREVASSEDLGGLASMTVVAGNFGIAMNGTHYFEAFRYLTGEIPVEVAAWFGDTNLPNPRGAQFADAAGTVRAATGGGARFYLDASPDQGHGLTVVYGCRHGQIVTDELAGTMEVVAREAEHRPLPTTRYGMPATRRSRRIAPADVIAPSVAVLRALLDDSGYPSGADGRAAVAALVGAYVSHEDGHRTVKLDDHLPRGRRFPWA